MSDHDGEIKPRVGTRLAISNDETKFGYASQKRERAAQERPTDAVSGFCAVLILFVLVAIVAMAALVLVSAIQ